VTLQKSPVLPTIIIDEANELQHWKETETNQLKALLRSFLLITKEAKLAHVVLATSDLSFEMWLGESTLSSQLLGARVCQHCQIAHSAQDVLSHIGGANRMLLCFRNRTPAIHCQSAW